jgi:hypothetical protein
MRISIASICLLMCLTMSAVGQPLPEPIVYYPFDVSHRDYSGVGNNGELRGPAAISTGSVGHSGAAGDGALELGAYNNGAWVNIPSAADGALDSLTANDTATISLWIFGNDQQPQNNWTFLAEPGRQLGSHAPWSDGTIYFDVAGCCGANQRISAPAPSPDDFRGRWNHYAYVKDTDSTAVYINGELLVDSGANAMLPLGRITSFALGASNTGSESHGGKFDDFAIFDTALTAAQIASIADGADLPRGQVRIAGPGSAVGTETLPISNIEFESDRQPTSVAGLTMEVYKDLVLTNQSGWTNHLIGIPTPTARGTVPWINWDEVPDNATAELGAPNSYDDAQPLIDAGLTEEAPDNFSNYSVRMTGEIQIPANQVRFKDGNDDYTYLAIDLDGDDQVETSEVLIDDNNWAPWNGANVSDGTTPSPIAVANFTGSIAGEDAWRRIEFRMAEGGGDDNGVLFWDQNAGGFFDEFTVPSDFLEAPDVVPQNRFRTFQEELTGVNVSSSFSEAAVFDVLVEQLDWDRLKTPALATTLDLTGAEFQVNVLDPANLTAGFTIDLIRDDTITEIIGTPTVSFVNTDAADWDTSDFATTGQLTFTGGQVIGIAGDYNGNGAVEQADLDLVLLNWGTGGVPAGWINDLPEGNIDQAELDGVLLNWGDTGAVGSAGSVPEPSTLALVLVAIGLGLGLVRRR